MNQSDLSNGPAGENAWSRPLFQAKAWTRPRFEKEVQGSLDIGFGFIMLESK